jgi:hypothetical protein
LSAVGKFLWNSGRCEAEYFLLAKGKNAKVSPKGKMQNAAPFLKERVDRSH